MEKRKIIIGLILLIIVNSCDLDNRKKDFYDISGGYVDIRLPLIKPYVLSRAESNPDDTWNNSWCIRFRNSFGTYAVKSIDIQDSIIYLRSGNIDNNLDSLYFEGKLVNAIWYILDLKTKTELEFENEKDLLKEVIKNNYPNPRWQNLDSLSKAISKAGKLPWDPRKKVN